MNEKTMTTKELADFFGKSVPTITRIANKVGILFENGIAKMYTKGEVELISRALYKKVPIFLQKAIDDSFGKDKTFANEKVKTFANEKLELSDDELKRTFMLAMVNMNNIAQSLANKTDELDKRISNIEVQTEKRKSLLPAPQIKPRDHINMIVREYAYKTGKKYSDVWSELYKQFSYRTNTDPRTCAKNRNMGILEYIELEGFIETLEAIAIDVFKED